MVGGRNPDCRLSFPAQPLRPSGWTELECLMRVLGLTSCMGNPLSAAWILASHPHPLFVPPATTRQLPGSGLALCQPSSTTSFIVRPSAALPMPHWNSDLPFSPSALAPSEQGRNWIRALPLSRFPPKTHGRGLPMLPHLARIRYITTHSAANRPMPLSFPHRKDRRIPRCTGQALELLARPRP